MSYRLVFLFTALLTSLPLAAHADLIVNVGDATILAGGTASLDVSIESDTVDLLQTFGFEFRITTGGVTRLEFFDPQSDSQLTDPDYVFFGDSFNQINGFPVGTVSTTSVPGDTFIGGDSTDSFLDFALTSSKLLARLDLTAQTGLAPQVGDTFDVVLDENSFNTFFADGFFTPLTINTAQSDLPGTVAVVVPEATSLGLCSLGLVGYLSRRRRHT